MTDQRDRFRTMLEEMTAWCDEQEAAGWPSSEMEVAAKRVSMWLWICARNKPVNPVILRSLAEDTEALAKARGDKPV